MMHTWRVHTYAQWLNVDVDATPEEIELLTLAVIERLQRFCRRHCLRPIGDAHVLVVNQSELWSRSFIEGRIGPIVLAEIRAAGTPPRERSPHGWRGRLRALLCAP